MAGLQMQAEAYRQASMLAELLARSEPPSRSKRKGKNLPPSPELFVAFLTEYQSEASTAFFPLGPNKEKSSKTVISGQMTPSLTSHDRCILRLLITGVGGISIQDYRPVGFV